MADCYSKVSELLTGATIISVECHRFDYSQVFDRYDNGNFMVFKYSKNGEIKEMAISLDAIAHSYYIHNNEEWNKILDPVDNDS